MTARPVMGGLLVIALTLLWGGSFFFTEVALAGLPPFTVVLGRVGPASSPAPAPPTCLLVTFLIPVSALALGIGLLGEHLAPGHLGGMALIALGLAAIDGRAWAWLAARRRPGWPLQLRP